MKEIDRLQLEIKGLVQGVGFRPHVYRIAKELQLTGYVFNHASGVTVEVQGERANLFEKVLKETLPLLARIDFVEIKPIKCLSEETEFKIIQSQSGKKVNTNVSPDVCICEECLHELFDPNSRFYLYPFLNCTNCGPRYTIIQDLPYDRCKTTMSPFPLCEDCQQDYIDPLNRRYHAQPTACHQCGPQLSMPIKEIIQHIEEGCILALKGMGGYQLICDAKNSKAVSRLRKQKQRDAKPFAVMALNVISAKEFVDVSLDEEELLTSWQRPIVLLKKKAELLATEIAPQLSEYGVMLPYTPLHYLLFYGLSGNPKNHGWLNAFNTNALVVTSANISGNPLIIDDDEAKSKLKNIADHIISYNRKILMRADDSVARIVQKEPFYIRRARGLTPKSIKLLHEISAGLAFGGHLKNTFCVTRGDEAYVSQYVGDMDNANTIKFFHETLDHLLKLLDVKPEFIAHDLHPDFYTTQLAKTFDLPCYPVQHHHAHLASVAAEHHIEEPILGLSLDGYGYGEGGGSWGGELMLLEGGEYKRLGHLKELAQPGGDRAAQEPWRMAASVLHALGLRNEIVDFFPNEKNALAISEMLKQKVNSPVTSSCGRLFDAASAILKINNINQYEGQAAMRLESLVTDPAIFEEGWVVKEGNLDLLPLMEYLLMCDVVEGANIFHGTLVQALADWITQASQKQQINKIVLSGGCFLNKVLADNLFNQLAKNNIHVFLPRQLPPNDGGISLGQLWVAALRHLKQ